MIDKLSLQKPLHFRHFIKGQEEEFTQAKYIMALDTGTTSNRCILFNEAGEMVSVAHITKSGGPI